MSTTVLWRPTGPEELEQPIFYPVLDEDYAIKIAKEWNVPHSGVGYVTRFRVDSEFLRRVHEFR